MRKTLYIFILILVSGEFIAQQKDTSLHFLMGLEYGNIYAASAMITTPAEAEARFISIEQRRMPGVFLSKVSNHQANYLALRFSLKRNRHEDEVPRIGDQLDTIPNQFVSDLTRKRASIVDIERGRLWFRPLLGPIRMAYGAGLYTTVASASEEFITENNLEGYVGRVISTDTRLRVSAGIRPRVEIHIPLLKTFSMSAGATFQAGFVSLPDVESRKIEYVIPDPEPQIVREIEDMNDFAWRTSESVDLWFRINFNLRP